MLWLPQYFGEFTLQGVFPPLDWHAHETVFGYGGAIVTGFLLTAVPNWTGRLPISGLAVGFAGPGLVGRTRGDCFFRAPWMAFRGVDRLRVSWVGLRGHRA